jgi:hypothetical protein
MLKFLDPTSTVQVTSVPGFAVGNLTGARVALIDNSKENAGYLLGVVGEHLRDRWGADLVTYKKRVASEPLVTEHFDEAIQTCALVITGLGD